MKYNFGGSLKQKMYGDLTGNYYSTNHFVETNNLEHIAEELFGENWEAEDDVEQIKQIIDFIGHNKLYVIVVPPDRSEWHDLMSTYGDSLSNLVGDSNYDIFVIDSSEYKGEYEFGGKIKYTNKFKSVGTIGSDEFYIRNFGKVSTEYFDDIELLVVAKIQDLNEYISQEEIEKIGGEFQLNITLIPTEKHLSLDIVAEARENSGLINDIISVENYMGGLNYSPEDKSIFKTFDEAEEYLMSKELNDKISADSVLSGYILDNKYNRVGQSNWDFLAYMMGEKESFWGNGGQITESDFNTNKELRIGNVKLILKKLQNPTYYRVEEYLLEGDTWEKYGSFGSRNWNDVVQEINFISKNKGYEGQYEDGGFTSEEFSIGGIVEKSVIDFDDDYMLYQSDDKIVRTLIETIKKFAKGYDNTYTFSIETPSANNISFRIETSIQPISISFDRGNNFVRLYGYKYDDSIRSSGQPYEDIKNTDQYTYVKNWLNKYKPLTSFRGLTNFNIDSEINSLELNKNMSLKQKYWNEDNSNKYANGGGVGQEISKEQLENMVGRKLNGWNDDKVEHKGVLYQKCFLKPYFKKC